jgi:hypothetical protein
METMRSQSFGAFGLDSAIIDLLGELGFFGLFTRLGWRKRSGRELGELIVLLLLRPLLNAPSISLFCVEHFRAVFHTSKDAFYRLLQRQYSWRDAHWRLVAKVLPAWRKLELGHGYLVADATLRPKRGRRMEGVCWHHDHVTGRKVMGLQVAALVWVNQQGALALDAALRLSRSPLIGNLVALLMRRHDGRSVLGRRVRESAFQDKLQQTLAMAKRAVRAGIPARYLLADSWYGCAAFIQGVVKLGLVPLVRWKRTKEKFILAGQPLTMEALWSGHAKANVRKVRGSLRFKGTFLDVTHPEMGAVRLFFIKLRNPDTGAKEWGVFLTTDRTMGLSAMVGHYAHRWGIEVFFKEAKQHLGLLEESVQSFEAVLACLHLTLMRQAVLATLAATRGISRRQASGQIIALSYAAKLWAVFQWQIAGAIDQLDFLDEDHKNAILVAISDRVEEWLAQALLMDVIGLQRQSLAEMNCET